MLTNNICLIIPPSPFLLDERVFMHLGILKVAAVLEQQDYHVDLLDLSGVKEYIPALNRYLEIYSIATYGITSTTPQMPFAVKIANAIRTVKPKSKIIIGGAHASLMNSARKKETTGGRATQDISRILQHFDIIVAGDGEKAIFEALSITKGIIDADIPNGKLFLTNSELDSLPNPARHLIDVDSYHYNIDGEKAISLICQLGCPFACAFCGGRNSAFLRRIRTRSSDLVVEEIRELYKTYGFTGFMFYDDELNVSKQWESLLLSLIKLQEELLVSFKLRGFVKAELFNQHQAELMYKAGFRWLLTGFESGDERILKTIEKIATVEDNTKCIKQAKKAGLKVKALMSIGHAGESKETIKNTEDWLISVQPDDFDCSIITVYPGSPYFDEAVYKDNIYVYTNKKTGAKLYQKPIDYMKDSDYYKGDPEDGYTSYVWSDYISSEELIIERNNLEKKIRETLGIPFNPTGKHIEFECSMGQRHISKKILRSSRETR